MTPLVGHEINLIDRPPAPGARVDLGTAFIVGTCGRAAHDGPTHVYSMADYELYCGLRADGLTLYDAVETFFAEGGRHAVIGRVVGAVPVKASAVAFDAAGSTGTDDALLITAKTVGEWGNSLNFEIVAGDAAGEFKIVISHDTDTGVAETSPSLADRDAAVVWGEAARWVDVELGDSAEDPRVQGSTSFTGGDDDDDTIADATWVTALASLGAGLGCGQVLAPGRTTTTGHTQLLQHAKDCNRVALLDLANTATVGTLTTASLAVRALTLNLPRYGRIEAQWAKIPGIAGSTSRTVPYSAVQAGLIARGASAGLSANDPVAGENGVARYVTELAVEFDADDRDALYSAGSNPAAVIAGTIRTYGDRTSVNAFTDPNWVGFANVRLLMEIKARADSILESYVLKKIDAKRLIFKRLYSQIDGVLKEYPNDLDGYSIDTDTVNTAVTIAAREINAAVDVQPSGFAEKVRMNLSKTTMGV